MFSREKSVAGWIDFNRSIPPLNPLIIFILAKISTNYIWIRLPSLVISVFSFLFIFKMAEKYGKISGLISLIITSISNYQLIYSFQSYLYIYLEFFVVVSLFLFNKLYFEKYNKKGKHFLGFLFFLVNVCGWLTHYSYIFYLFVLAMFFLIDSFFGKKKNVNFNLVLFSFGGFLLVWILYLPIFINILGGGYYLFYSEPISYRMISSTVLYLFGIFNYDVLYKNLFVALLGLILLGIIFLSGVKNIFYKERKGFFLLNFLMFYFVLIFLSVLSFSFFVKSFFQYRVLIIIFPSLVLITSYLFSRVKNVFLQNFLLIGMCGYYLYELFLCINTNLVKRDSFLRTGKDSFLLSECLKDKKISDTQFLFYPKYIAPEFKYFWFNGDIKKIEKYGESVFNKKMAIIYYNEPIEKKECEISENLCQFKTVKAFTCKNEK